MCPVKHVLIKDMWSEKKFGQLKAGLNMLTHQPLGNLNEILGE